MRTSLRRALILTQTPFLAIGLSEMLRAKGFEVMLPGDGQDPAEGVAPGDALLVIVHGESETCLQLATELHRKFPNSVFVLWTAKITLDIALQALAVGVRSVLSTKLSPEITTATLLQIWDGDEYQLRLTTDSICRQGNVPRLTAREKQILQLVKSAAKNKEIAHALRLTEGTVRVYMNKLLRKTGFTNRLELAQWSPASGESWSRSEWPMPPSRHIPSLPCLKGSWPLCPAANA